MITAVDSNVLIDVFGADPKYGQLSAKMLRQCLDEGALCACPVVWAEVATLFPGRQRFLEAMDVLNIEFSDISLEGALLAAENWQNYRKQGGKRERIIADFLIGAHASTQCNRLLTRDRGFYKNYFSKCEIINPA